MGTNQLPTEICTACRLRRLPVFSANAAEQVAFVQERKVGELVVAAGATIIEEGQRADRVYTLLKGWAFRYKTLPDGRRLILSFLLPGDLVGLQAKLFEEATNGTEALTDATFCAFSRNKIWDVFESWPQLAFDLTWLCAHEERIVDDTLLSVGRRSAAERVAWLVVHLWQRADQLGMVRDGSLSFPISQAHIADALGLSVVHTNRTIQALRKRRLLEWTGGTLKVRLAALQEAARYTDEVPERRPLF